jgi:metal-responsive CopG/Arc/MetJ family transcriptional regulator
MKTAISVPDAVFREVEQYARRAKKSRSQVYSEAVAEYLARHVPDAVTEAMNEVCSRVGDETDAFVQAASRRVLSERTGKISVKKLELVLTGIDIVLGR